MAKIKHKINIAKKYDHSCRNNGACEYCRESRTHNVEKHRPDFKDMMEEIEAEREDFIRECEMLELEFADWTFSGEWELTPIERFDKIMRIDRW